MPIYTQINGTTQEVSNPTVNCGGVQTPAASIWGGIGGVNTLLWEKPASGPTLADLEIGAKVKDPNSCFYPGEPLCWTIIDKSHEGYPADFVTLMASYIYMIRVFDANESDNPEFQSGNRRYHYSNLRQWLNSDAPAGGSWYQPQHTYDTPPDSAASLVCPYHQEQGFLAYLSDDFRQAILTTPVKVLLPLDDNVADPITLYDKVYLISATEVNGTEKYPESSPEGTLFAYFQQEGASIGYTTQSCYDNNPIERVNYAPNAPFYWSTRSAPHNRTGNNTLLYVSTTGAFMVGRAGVETIDGCRPLLNLSMDTPVSSEPDEDGVYLLEFSRL